MTRLNKDLKMRPDEMKKEAKNRFSYIHAKIFINQGLKKQKKKEGGGGGGGKGGW